MIDLSGKAGKYYGCWNSETKPSYEGHPWNVLGGVDIPDVFTTECQFRKGTPNDPRCEGCLK